MDPESVLGASCTDIHLVWEVSAFLSEGWEKVVSSGEVREHAVYCFEGKCEEILSYVVFSGIDDRVYMCA